MEHTSPDLRNSSIATNSSPKSSYHDSDMAANQNGVSYAQKSGHTGTGNLLHDSPTSSFAASNNANESERQSVTHVQALAEAQACYGNPSSQLPSTSSLEDIVSERYSPFDAETLVVQPFQEEAIRGARFEEELANKLLHLLLITHAWGSARPKHEAANQSLLLEDNVARVMEEEREQEQTRLRLHEFVSRMKNALAALTGAF